MKIGIIGIGTWGVNYVRVFSQIAEVSDIYCCDIDEERLGMLQKEWKKVHVSTSQDELLGHPEIEAVVIATPAKYHYPQAKQALGAGKHVLVEKPWVSTYSQAQELFALARQEKLVLKVGHIMLHNPAYKALKKLVADGELGRLSHLRFERTHLGIVREDVDILDDLGPHDISMLLDLTGQLPVKVWARGMGIVSRQGVDSLVITVSFPRGLYAYLYFSWLEPLKVRKCVVVGDEKMAVFDDMEPTHKVTIYDYQVARNFQEQPGRFYYSCGSMVSPYVDLSEPLKLECLDFLAAIKGKAAVNNDELPLWVQAIMDAARLSLSRDGESIQVSTTVI